MRRDPWQALADPTRRQIIEVLSEKAQTVNAIAHNFEISRPAISKQLKILEESSLISIEQQGRERLCTLSLEPLSEVFNWVQQYQHFWLKKLDNLDDYLNQME
ncbi:MAG: metalloregulator ArsR/SmtB family transcription factor [Bacteroidota bacterium]